MRTMMTIFSLFVFLFTSAQDLSVFRQEVIGGAMKLFTDEHGQEYKSGQRETITYIYLRTAQQPRIKQVWVDGERFEFKVVEEKGPVVMKKQLSLPAETDTLVTARNKEKIYRIIPGRKLGDGKKKNHGVTIVTKWRNYITDEVKTLEPFYNQ